MLTGLFKYDRNKCVLWRFGSLILAVITLIGLINTAGELTHLKVKTWIALEGHNRSFCLHLESLQFLQDCTIQNPLIRKKEIAGNRLHWCRPAGKFRLCLLVGFVFAGKGDIVYNVCWSLYSLFVFYIIYLLFTIQCE